VPTTSTPRSQLFWRLAEELYADPAVVRGTMMGFPCLRVSGEFFASLHKDDHHLVVKLPAERVAALVDSGQGQPFAPAGRVFREWVVVPDPDEAEWRALLAEAKDFVRPGG
jgi:hypothetical protein